VERSSYPFHKIATVAGITTEMIGEHWMRDPNREAPAIMFWVGIGAAVYTGLFAGAIGIARTARTNDPEETAMLDRWFDARRDEDSHRPAA
jgi:hypothetical protein